MDPKSDERRTPLFLAAENGAVDVLKLLMERGADVTIRDIELRSVLHGAVGHPHAMEVLLQVNQIRRRLLCASEEDETQCAKLLLRLSMFKRRITLSR